MSTSSFFSAGAALAGAAGFADCASATGRPTTKTANSSAQSNAIDRFIASPSSSGQRGTSGETRVRIDSSRARRLDYTTTGAAEQRARAPPARSMLHAMTFTSDLWASIEPIYAAILRHPFVAGLTDGSLPRARFQFYAVQDALYLREFARALSLAAARAPRDEWIIMFNDHAANALRVERSLHESFFAEFGLTPKAVAATPLAPTNLAYTSYLVAVAYGAPFHEGLAA